MAITYISTLTLIGICSALLHRIARRPEEESVEVVDWRDLPDDVYLSDALYARLGGKA